MFSITAFFTEGDKLHFNCREDYSEEGSGPLRAAVDCVDVGIVVGDCLGNLGLSRMDVVAAAMVDYCLDVDLFGDSLDEQLTQAWKDLRLAAWKILDYWQVHDLELAGELRRPKDVVVPPAPAGQRGERALAQQLANAAPLQSSSITSPVEPFVIRDEDEEMDLPEADQWYADPDDHPEEATHDA